MPTSQNGYSAGDESVIRSATIPGTDVRVRVRTGPAGDILLYAAARWHREVEPLRAPDGVLDCWGYAFRPIRGATQLSNHASGTALDLRARAHPLGVDPGRTFTPAQIVAARRIVDTCDGALRWGGDYGNPARGGVAGSRWDAMHLEAHASEARCGEVLARLTASGGDTPAPAGPYCVYGERSDHVMTLQRFMTSHFPSYNRYRPTGFFGEATRNGLEEFQRRTGLAADGIPGPLTMAKLREYGFTP